VQSKCVKLLRRIIYPFANKIVFVTNSDRNKFGHPQKSATIYNPAIFEPYANYNNRQNTVITIAPTDRWYNKGLDLLVKAWTKIESQYPEWSLEIYGRNNGTILPAAITQQERILWKGWRDDIAEVLRTKSIFVLASRFEGCPNSLIEAMSQGCACIGTDCEGGIKEIITDGIDGIIAQCGNVDNIAEKLQLLIDNENLRRELSAKAIEKVKQFDKNAFFEKWDNLIDVVTRK
jgi:glycosyltransferase involved in cell wall biosynthesis